MRGLRSTIAARRRPGRARRLHLLRHLEAAGRRRRPTRRSREGLRGARSRQDRGDQGRRRRAGDATTLKKEGGAGRSSQPITAEGRRVGSVGHHQRARPDRSRRASSTRTRPTSTTTASSNPRIEIDFKAAGDKDYRQAARRRQVADRRRSLRQAQRREAGVPDSGVPGNLVQPDDVRPARQDRS